ncbi:MAG: hypothetical protein EOM12_19225 [Verrucomicrobiae bacterium]|nr:hypothetical protein [Verrucomicrobiae bacterium]
MSGSEYVGYSCEKCNREGQLVCQSVQPPLEMKRGEAPVPWVFRYYLCRWHRAAENRSRTNGQRKMNVLEYIDDATLLANAIGKERTADETGKDVEV